MLLQLLVLRHSQRCGLGSFKERWSPGGDHTVRALAELLPLVDRLQA